MDQIKTLTVIAYFQGLHQDVVAYENVVDSLCNKASQLSSGAAPKDLDSEVLQKRYNDLKVCQVLLKVLQIDDNC